MEARGTVLPHSGEKGQPNFELVEQRSADVGQIGLSRGELLPGHHRVASCRTLPSPAEFTRSGARYCSQFISGVLGCSFMAVLNGLYKIRLPSSWPAFFG